MSKTSLRKKSKTRIPDDLKDDQDQRLSSRHISALIKLEDVVLENESLKQKVNVLEKEVASCIDLHKFARDAKVQLQNAEQQYKTKLDIILTESSLKIDIKEKKMQKVLVENNIMYEEKISLANLEIEKLKTGFSDIEKEKKRLQEDDEKWKKNLDNYDYHFSQDEKSIQQIKELTAKVEGLKTENSNLKSNINLQDAKILQQDEKIDALTTELKLTMELNAKLSYENVLYEEINQITSNVKDLEIKLQTEVTEHEETQKRFQEFQNTIQILQKDYDIVLIERDVLKQSMMDLRLENETLKAKNTGNALQHSNALQHKNSKEVLPKKSKEKLNNADRKFKYTYAKNL